MQFDGQPLPSGIQEVSGPAMLGLVLSGLLIVILRNRFEREWHLTLWTWIDIQRVWKRLPNESARSGGIMLSHLIGFMAWAILGSILWPESPWKGLSYGFLTGLTVGLARRLGQTFGKWLTREHEVLDNHAELDRHMRTALTVVLGLGIVFMALRFPNEMGWKEHIPSAVFIWLGWLIIKWLKCIQLLLHRRVRIGWGIAYLCTLEITPTVALVVKGLGV